MIEKDYLSNLLPGVLGQLHQQAKRAKYLEDPVLWALDYLGIHLWASQRDILYSIRDNRATAVAAGHGTGKTYCVAVAAAWWVDVHPIDKTFVASTAPSADQVDLLWDNIRNVHALARRRFEEGIIDHPLPGYITGDNKWKIEGGASIGQGRKPPDNKSDVAFQGRHADYLLAIGDEAVGLSEGFLNALGVIATGQFNRQVLIANPTDPTCAMAKIWKDKNPNWHTMHISVMDSPRITEEEGWDNAWAPGLSGWEFVDQARSDYGGEDDPRFISRVLGQWSFDSGNNLFTEEEIARGKNAYVLPDPGATMEFGCDIARMGADSSFIYTIHEGDIWERDDETNKPLQPTDRRGIQLRYLDSWKKAPLVGGTAENPGTAERIHAHAIANGVRVVKIDASGIGIGVIDGLNILNQNNYYIVEVYGGAAPSDRRAYINMRAEQFFSLKQRLYAGEIDIDPKDEALQDELRGIIYQYTDNGAQKIEAKDSMKRRGVKSPDRADAMWYACLDVSEFTDNGVNQLKPGSTVVVDPWQMMQMEMRGAGMAVM